MEDKADGSSRISGFSARALFHSHDLKERTKRHRAVI